MKHWTSADIYRDPKPYANDRPDIAYVADHRELFTEEFLHAVEAELTVTEEPITELTDE
jgi:hypothetical protein